MVPAIVELKYICGFSGCDYNSILFLDDETLIYLVGKRCVIHNTEQKKQRFLETEEIGEVNIMCLSLTRRFFALSAKGVDAPPSIHVYDMTVLKKRKIVTCADVQSDVFISLDFSVDTKLLAGLSGGPQFSIVIWQWEKGRILTCFHPQNLSPNSEVYQILFSQEDPNNVYTVGKFNFRLYRYGDGTLKQLAFQKFEYYQHYLCMHWLQKNLLAVGSYAGFIHIYEGSEIKQELKGSGIEDGDGSVTNVQVDEELEDEETEGQESGKKKPVKGAPIRMLSAAGKGLVCSSGDNSVVMFELFENKYYRYMRTVKLPSEEEKLLADVRGEEEEPQKDEEVSWIAISPEHEILAACTTHRKIFVFYVSGADLMRSNKPIFQPLSQPQHTEKIRDMDICIRKPLVATCSADDVMYIWDYDTGNLNYYKKYHVEVYSLAFHPSGLFIIIGFADQLQFNTILLDDLREVKSYPIKYCCQCVFSHGGHLFAATNDLIIYVYSTITMDVIGTLKGHYGQITAIRFSQDDQAFHSCGRDGAIYEWNVYHSLRVNESVRKTCQYSDITLSTDGHIVYCIGSDHTIKEIADSAILKEHAFPNYDMTCILLTNSGNSLIIGTEDGELLTTKFPMLYDVMLDPLNAHTKKITKMKTTYDDQLLVTTGDDGCVCMWKITEKETIGKKERAVVPYTEEILITRRELMEKKEQVTTLQKRVEEISSESEYKLRLKDMVHTQFVRNLSDKYEAELQELNTKIAALQDDKRNETAKAEEVLMRLKEDHETEMQDEDYAYRQKLLDEYNRFDNLRTEYEETKDQYEKKIANLEETNRINYSSMTENYEAQIRILRQEHMLAKEEVTRIKEEHLEWQQQVEDDTDFEILQIKTQYEKQLKEERDANAELKGEATLLIKKLNNMKREIDERQTTIRKFHTEETKLQTVIKNLEREIFLLKKEIVDRDQTIQEKETDIHGLRRENQQVEKFNFVLKFNLEEVEKQLKPKERENSALQAQVQNVENELTKFHYANKNFKRTISELQSKVHTSEKAAKKEKDKAFKLETILERYRADLHQCSGLIQEPKKLVDTIIMLHKKHIHEMKQAKKTQDQSLQEEFLRQRQHLERSVATLRRKLNQDTETHQSDYVRLLQENSELIKEINMLRKEMKTARNKVIDMEMILGITAAEFTAIGDTRNRLEDIVLLARDKQSAHEEEMTERENVIKFQSLEIQKLQNSLISLKKQMRKLTQGPSLMEERKVK